MTLADSSDCGGEETVAVWARVCGCALDTEEAVIVRPRLVAREVPAAALLFLFMLHEIASQQWKAARAAYDAARRAAEGAGRIRS